MMPFSRTVNLRDGTIIDPVAITKRTLTDLKGFFADQEAEQDRLTENPLIYEEFEATENPTVAGQLRYSTTVIRPGNIGDEYFMTKGHYHALGDRAELYYGLLGTGYLLLQTREGEINIQPMTPGVVAFVPPYGGQIILFSWLFILLMQAMTTTLLPNVASLRLWLSAKATHNLSLTHAIVRDGL